MKITKPEHVDDLSPGEFVALFAACQRRLLSGKVGTRYRIQAPWPGCNFSEDDILLGELARAEELAGVPYGRLDIAANARHLLAVIQARMEITGDLTEADVARELVRYPFADALKWISTEAVGDNKTEHADPKADSADGSSGDQT